MSKQSIFLLGVILLLASVSTATVTVDFPLGNDTWYVSSYPYWYSVGDTVYGDRDLGTLEFYEVTIHLPISYNVLNDGGHVDLDLRLDGITVASFIIYESDGVGMWEETFSISYTPSGTEEVRYYETNEVPSGDGSISISVENGYLEFEAYPEVVQPASLGYVKAMFN